MSLRFLVTKVRYPEQDFVDTKEGLYNLNKYDFNGELASFAWELLSVNFTDRLFRLVENKTLYFDIMMGEGDEVLREAHMAKSLEALTSAILRWCNSLTKFIVHMRSSRQCVEIEEVDDDVLEAHTMVVQWRRLIRSSWDDIQVVKCNVVILLNRNVTLILLFVTMPAFLSGFFMGTILNFVLTATRKPNEENIHHESQMKKVSSVLSTQTVGSKE